MAGPKWLAGSILKAQGPLSYEVEISDGRVARRHVDHIRIRTVPDTAHPTADEDGVPMLPPPNPAQTQDVANADNDQGTPALRRSGRERRQPSRLDL